MNELLMWLNAAYTIRHNCGNLDEFDVLIAHQKRRLKKLLVMPEAP